MRTHGFFTARFDDGESARPFDRANYSDGVGDDPAAVAANRRALAQRAGVEAGQLVFMRQVHGRAVAVVDGPRDTPVADVDALVTAVPGVALAVLAADCLPVLLADAVAGVVGAVHAGRRGVQLGVVGAAVRAMAGLGAGRIAAQLGPSIGACCYAVGRDVQAEVDAAVPGTATSTRNGEPALDLPAGVVSQLRLAGIVEIDAVDARCTADADDLFSYRRDGRTGRLAGVVVLVP